MKSLLLQLVLTARQARNKALMKPQSVGLLCMHPRGRVGWTGGCFLQDSVAQKRRSCSGSRNGTPAVRDRRSASVDPEAAALMAEDSALDAALAAAEAAAAHIEKQVLS